MYPEPPQASDAVELNASRSHHDGTSPVVEEVDARLIASGMYCRSESQGTGAGGSTSRSSRLHHGSSQDEDGVEYIANGVHHRGLSQVASDNHHSPTLVRDVPLRFQSSQVALDEYDSSDSHSSSTPLASVPAFTNHHVTAPPGQRTNPHSILDQLESNSVTPDVPLQGIDQGSSGARKSRPKQSHKPSAIKVELTREDEAVMNEEVVYIRTEISDDGKKTDHIYECRWSGIRHSDGDEMKVCGKKFRTKTVAERHYKDVHLNIR